MFHVFIFDSFNYALIFSELLFACTLHLMLYSAPHNDYMSTVVSAICIYSFVMSLFAYYALVVLVVPNKSYLKSYLILSYLTDSIHEPGTAATLPVVTVRVAEHLVVTYEVRRTRELHDHLVAETGIKFTITDIVI